MSAAVSHHASFRYLERVDAREPWPAERVLEALDRAEPDPDADVVGRAFYDGETDTTLVVAPDGCVRTLLRGRKR
jgi:hypothetical protein